jgi:hypothetical protein
MEREPDEVLAGGVANAGRVVRSGDEVRRPANAHSPAIHRFLSALAAAGFDGAPVPLGIEAGRERLRFVAGDVPVPPYPTWAQQDATLASIARLLSRFHAASRDFDASASTWSTEMQDPAGATPTGAVMCHNDVCLENVVFRAGKAAALLDFDFVAPGRPIYDLAQMARMCVPIDDDANAGRLGWGPVDRPGRLRLIADEYGLDAHGRSELLEILATSIMRGGEFVRRRVEAGDPNFIRMWGEMGGAARFDRRREWFNAQREQFVNALC